MKPLLYSILFILLPLYAAAQVTLLHDIVHGSGSHPRQKIVFNGKLMFIAGPWGASGALWSYNDTVLNKIQDSCKMYACGGAPGMAVCAGKLYFTSYANGVTLMAWDGINKPSLAAKLNSPMFGGHYPEELFSHNDKLYFQAFTPDHGIELWTHDPASNITRRLGDINPGTQGSDPEGFIAFNKKIYFRAYDFVKHAELYEYDPAKDTITLVADINTTPGPQGVGSYPHPYAVLGNKLYFSAYTPAYGNELYFYDGSHVVRLSDINPGPETSVSGSGPWWLNSHFVLNNKLYFGALVGPKVNGKKYMLHVYDPGQSIGPNNPSAVPAGTHELSNCEFIEFKGKIYFCGLEKGGNGELWMFDGTTTSKVAEIGLNSVPGDPMYFTIFKDNLYFTARTHQYNEEVYRFNGNAMSIEHVSAVNGIKVYPIPANQSLHFDLELQNNEAFTVSLIDINGHNVLLSDRQYPQGGHASYEADISKLVSATYFYRIISDNGTLLASGKFIKQ